MSEIRGSAESRGGSPEIEVDADRAQDVDWGAGETTRLESPLGHGGDRLLIESSRIEGAEDPDLRGTSFARHDGLEEHAALDSALKCVGRVRGLHLGDYARRGHGTTRPIDTAAGPAAGSRTEPWSAPGTDAVPNPRPHAAAGSRTCRRSFRTLTDRQPALIARARRERPRIEHDRRRCRYPFEESR